MWDHNWFAEIELGRWRGIFELTADADLALQLLCVFQLLGRDE